jgi:radical SAM protein with 4Fe4S-binding SPASM domain
MNWMFYLKTTETCNLNCKHCFTNGTNGAKVFWNHYKIIDWIKRFAEYRKDFLKEDSLHCEFHGGEPFLVPTFQMRHVWEDCKDLFPNMTWGATTNLVYKLDEEQIDLIKDCFDNRIGTSWDPKIRFANQKQNDLWLKNVKTVVDRGIDVKLFISVTKDTVDIEPIELLKWVKSLGIKELSFERLTGNGNANLHPEIFPTNIEQDAWFLKMHHQSEEHGCREWFDNEFLETIYGKFETGFLKGGTFCRDCEEKLFTVNADGTISGCPNSAPEFQFGNIDDDIKTLINSPIRIENIACERSRDPRCYSCDVFEYCGGDCHQLGWQDDVCGAPKSLMRFLKNNQKRKIWMIKDGNIK